MATVRDILAEFRLDQIYGTRHISRTPNYNIQMERKKFFDKKNY